MQNSTIDVNFNFLTDSRGRDPDSHSPTLRRYHKKLWSKLLPNGRQFTLRDDVSAAYLYHNSEMGEFILGSDAITHSYRSQKKKQWLIEQVREEAQQLFDAGCNIGSYIIFPNKKIQGKQTINQARGVNRWIDDRFDLTLECIRRFYAHEPSPLYSDLLRYKNFFELFVDFRGYSEFFLLQDLLDEKSGKIKFYLPFDDFKSPPNFSGKDDYLKYKRGVLAFNAARRQRISRF